VGNSENYNEIYRLRKEIAQKFPEAFIIAFMDGKRINVNEARKMK
jgi:N-acetylmuramoyl-L-alanine amidase